jgi:hypothetical protein
MIARTLFAVTVAVAAVFPSCTFADGFLYQLPKDGAWVRFEEEGKGSRPDGTGVTVSGKLTISSVGTVDIDGKRCRWIEIATDTKMSDRPAIQHVVKLLIPEAHLGKGKEPLEHTLKAWSKHSAINDGQLQEIKDPAGNGATFLKNYVTPYLRGPFEDAENLEKATVDSKLGKLECAGLVAKEKRMIGNGVTIHYTHRVRLHERAHFGVVSFQSEMRMELDGQVGANMASTTTLSDSGTDATSAIPDAR